MVRAVVTHGSVTWIVFFTNFVKIPEKAVMTT